MGHIAENRHIRRALFAAAEGAQNLTYIAPAALTGLDVEPAHVTASLSDGRALRARLAVAADGRGSPMREEMGIGTIGWSYPQWGIVATVEHEHPHNGTAYEHFLPAGPFAILPMTPASAARQRARMGKQVLAGLDRARHHRPAHDEARRRRNLTPRSRAASERIWARRKPPVRAGPIRSISIWRALM